MTARTYISIHIGNENAVTFFKCNVGQSSASRKSVEIKVNVLSLSDK
jgi:hypothetical protein